jgi:hypothetical protein
MQSYQNAFSSGMNNKNSPAKKFMACRKNQDKGAPSLYNNNNNQAFHYRLKNIKRIL